MARVGYAGLPMSRGRFRSDRAPRRRAPKGARGVKRCIGRAYGSQASDREERAIEQSLELRRLTRKLMKRLDQAVERNERS